MRCGGGEKRWRSAICSSETRHRCLEQTAAEFLIFAAPPRFCNIIGAAIPCASRAMTALKSCATLQGCYPAIMGAGTTYFTSRRTSHSFARDRKSVVEGKSGSVRVTLGGRRIIKKKKNRT